MSHDAFLSSISELADQLLSLNQQAVREYTPIVESILRSHNCDANQIEYTLDGLLGFCGYEPALVLYKKLCRHYWEIDPVATASYVNAYREMWDSEANEKKPTHEDNSKKIRKLKMRNAPKAGDA